MCFVSSCHTPHAFVHGGQDGVPEDSLQQSCGESCEHKQMVCAHSTDRNFAAGAQIAACSSMASPVA